MRYRAIILDDDPFLRRLLSEILKGKGYEVLSAADPTICPIYADLCGVCTHEFACGDFLLTDNRMPHMSGLDFVIRQNQRGCKGAIRNKAIFSAGWNADDLATAGRLGCKAFHKPYNFAEIHAWLDAQAKMIPPDRKLDPLSDDL
jgi:CheY-like chemotaxis protein